MDSHTSRNSPAFVPASPALSDICWQCRYCPAARDCGHPGIPADGEHEEEDSCLECGKAAACIRDLNSRAREDELRCIELAKELRRQQVEMERQVEELGGELRASERRFRHTMREHLVVREEHSQWCLGLHAGVGVGPHPEEPREKRNLVFVSYKTEKEMSFENRMMQELVPFGCHRCESNHVGVHLSIERAAKAKKWRMALEARCADNTALREWHRTYYQNRINHNNHNNEALANKTEEFRVEVWQARAFAVPPSTNPRRSE